MAWREKTVLVTGGSSGLGLAIAEAFARRKARLVLVARDAERLERAAEAVQRHGADVLAVEADVTRQDDVERMIGRAIERFGRLDVLVNNAGRSTRGELLSETPEAIRELMELNFLAAVRCTRAAAEHLLQTRGHVVNIGSLASKSVSRYMGAYAATKHALDGYTHQLRLELGPRGLHSMLVCPGPIARDDAGPRYADDAAELPQGVNRPGAGVKLSLLRPEYVAERIVRGCERRRAELVMPGKARLLFAISALWPALGDWIIRRMTS